ncbi:MAG TPA: tetratricopeptide repeat protein [Thermoanaerobaculia bacterium]|nr:tetratricopeptide repeat protein [Thermoanaerobaculia bacterium]
MSKMERPVLRALLPGGVHLGLLCVLVLALTGCASPGPIVTDMERVLRSRGLDPAAVVLPYELDDEMRTWVHAQVPSAAPAEKKLELLLTGLLDPAKLRMQYEARSTGTAREVFRSRRANCLAFTSLFVGLAREVGVPVVYLDVDDVERFEKEGDLVVISGHVSAGFNTGTHLKILDFSAAPPTEYRKVYPISDLTAIALYHSNRGAEALRSNHNEEALDWLRKAVAIDPELGSAWVNYGVSLRRSGDIKAAEEAYRKALEADPTAVSAYQNLASLLRFQGKEKEAEDLLALSSRLGSRNPFIYLALGDVSFSHGRLEEARRFYRKALRLYRQNPEPYAAMGLLSLAVGDSGDAERWLRKAVAIDQENRRVKLLAQRLGG